METRICDRCKTTGCEPGKLPFVILHITYTGTDKETLSYWIGKKTKVDLCEECFNEFMRFNK